MHGVDVALRSYRSGPTPSATSGRTSLKSPAHSDANGLLRWLRTATGKPRHVYVVHGEFGPADTFAGRIRSELGWDASVPDYREVVELD